MKKIIVTTLAIVFSLSVFAQNTPTPYQKRQLELSKKYFQIFYGYRMSMADEVFYEQLAEGKDAQEFLLAMGILGYAMNHSEAQVKKVLTQMKNEYAQAEKLKNATDFRLEKEAKAKAEQAKKERELRATQEAYAKTDVGSIQKNIKSEFEKWNQKGEFEKEIDYTERLKNQSRTAFDSICLEKIETKINGFYSYYGTKELSKYNSEKEFFTVSFKINDLEWQSDINIPISQAEKFKNNFSDLRFKIGDYDWCFVENSLCPTLVTLTNRDNDTKYQFPVLLQNQSEITQSFNNLEIANQYLNGYVFKFSNAKVKKEKIAKEKQRLDSLELATINNRLDSIFNDYNRQLIQNKYNVNKVKLNDDFEAICNFCNHYYAYWRDKKYPNAGEIEGIHQMCVHEFGYLGSYKFKSSYYQTIKSIDENDSEEQIRSLKIKFDKLQKCFECEYWYNYYTNEGLFSENKTEFNNFYTQEKDIYQAEVEKRTILKYFSDNAKFIETMDFQKEAKETIGSAFMSDYTGTYTNYSKINADRKEILGAIRESQNKPYYPQILDFVIKTNKDLNKEWTKNGQYFEDKAAFYNAYISEDYKKILKEKKKK